MTRIKMAIAYDFDGTLAPGNMQEHSFLPEVEIKPQNFWENVEKIAKKEQADKVLVYMNQMLKVASQQGLKITSDEFKKHGKKIKLFEGVEKWFSEINKYAKNNDVDLKHYLISSGNKDILDGVSIVKEFEQVFASKYLFDENNVAVWPTLAINYTNKTQFLFRINKGITDISDDEKVNKYIPDTERPIPFKNMIFIGDGETDIPCFRLTKDQGGMSIAVYQPHSRNKNKLQELHEEGRIDAFFPANYNKGEKIYNAVCQRINYVVAYHKLNKLMNKKSRKK